MMEIHFYDSQHKCKRVFQPLDPQNVTMYVCGPTVYDQAHIGNARAFVVFDVVYRLLRWRYGQVTYVRNITDIDDKIIDRCHALNESWTSLTQRMTKIFQDDMFFMGCEEPTHSPLATDHIPQMIEMIKGLIDGGYAYVCQGHVLFSVCQYADYGRLSGQQLSDLNQGARVDVASYKRDGLDFVLWKPSLPSDPGWESPWGRGRPGWHIECSAMSRHYLGGSFDLHGGGVDLHFPHHENERAQSCCYDHDSSFARHWLHNGFLTFSGEKMSKSLGNIATLSQLKSEFSGLAVRWSLLSSHYRQPLSWEEGLLSQGQRFLDRYYQTLLDGADLNPLPYEVHEDDQVVLALCDDVNTPLCWHHIHQVMGDFHRSKDDDHRQDLISRLHFYGQLLGLDGHDGQSWFHGSVCKNDDLSVQEIEHQISQRQRSRVSGDYAQADAIRDHLSSHGVILEDRGGKTSWKRVCGKKG